MSFLNIPLDQSKSVTVESTDLENLYSYDAYESVLANSIFTKNEIEKTILEEFDSLKHQWLTDTMFESGYKRLVNHPAYLEIVSWGENIIPLLIRDMIDDKTPWFYALADITGENPIRKESEGRLDEIIRDWTNWAEKNNYI